MQTISCLLGKMAAALLSRAKIGILFAVGPVSGRS
jgi:hypothetical protein